MAKLTADETSLIRLHDQSIGAEENKEWTLSELETIFKQSEKRTYTIVVLLAQANFIKKTREGKFFITSNGIRLVEELKESM